VLILVPTRELAIQTCTVFEGLCQAFVRIVPGALIGGMKKKSEKDRIRRGLNILIATPGRLCDHLDTTMALDLSKVEYLIFDEADRYVNRLVFVFFKFFRQPFFFKKNAWYGLRKENQLHHIQVERQAQRIEPREATNHTYIGHAHDGNHGDRQTFECRKCNKYWHVVVERTSNSCGQQQRFEWKKRENSDTVESEKLLSYKSNEIAFDCIDFLSFG
jgi:hypothetical protein